MWAHLHMLPLPKKSCPGSSGDLGGQSSLSQQLWSQEQAALWRQAAELLIRDGQRPTAS